jgi:hypothetical protein
MLMERGFAKSSRKNARPVLDVTGVVAMDRTMSIHEDPARQAARFAQESHKHRLETR